MTDYKHILISFLATVVVIGGLASFVAYKNGELSRIQDADSRANVEIPFAADDEAVSESDFTRDPSRENALDTADISNESIRETADNTSTMNTTKSEQNPVVTFTTNKGSIDIELFMDRAPITVGNFIKLVNEGFYDTTKFHRVISGFMIQGGDPNSKGSDVSMYGRGGPGYSIKDEFASGLSNTRGTLSMANSGPNTGGSQFFINLVPNTYLDNKHAVFGKVISGMDVVDQISLVPRDPRDVPLAPVVLEHVAVKK
jgi:cyclophilin family peptidyl-prolyl cis-trans isomerase